MSGRGCTALPLHVNSSFIEEGRGVMLMIDILALIRSLASFFNIYYLLNERIFL